MLAVGDARQALALVEDDVLRGGPAVQKAFQRVVVHFGAAYGMAGPAQGVDHAQIAGERLLRLQGAPIGLDIVEEQNRQLFRGVR